MSDYLYVSPTNTNWTTNTNWSPSGPPSTSGDTALLDFNAVNALAGSDQTATTLTRLDITSTFIQTVGTQGTPLAIKAAAVNIGAASGGQAGTSSGRINLNLSTVASIVTIYSTKAATGSSDPALQPVRIKCNNANTKVYIYSGVAGIATDALGDTATLGELSVLGGNVRADIASGTTMTKLRMATGGTANVYCSCPSIINDAGIVNTYGSGTCNTTLQISGIANLSSNGTITNLVVFKGGVANLLGDTRLKTITNTTVYAGGMISYDPAIVTLTNPIQVPDGTLEDITVNTPKGITVVVAAI